MVGEFEIQNLSVRKDFLIFQRKSLQIGIASVGTVGRRIFKMIEFSVIKRNFEPMSFVRGY